MADVNLTREWASATPEQNVSSEWDEAVTIGATKSAAAGANLPAPKQEAQAPGTISRISQAVAKGMFEGGPIYSALRGGQELSEIGSKALEHGAYEAGGFVTDLAAKIVNPDIAAGAGFATNVGIQAIPTVIGGMAGKLGTPAMQSGARALMQSALKPSAQSLRTGKAAQAIETMFEHGVNVTPGGVAKLQRQIGVLNESIADAVKNSTAIVDKKAAAATLKDAITKFEKQVTPQADLAVIQKAYQEFMNHPLLAQAAGIPVKLAQEIKQGTYRALGAKSYGELGSADIEAQKGLARGLKDEIAKAIPGIDKMNKEESKLLNALSLASARVMTDANKNPMGLGWLAFHPTTWLGFAADRSPLVKSLVARLLNATSRAAPVTLGAGVGSLFGAEMGTPEGEIPPPPEGINP